MLVRHHSADMQPQGFGDLESWPVLQPVLQVGLGDVSKRWSSTFQADTL